MQHFFRAAVDFPLHQVELNSAAALLFLGVLMVDVSSVVSEISEAGTAAAAVGMAVLLVVVIVRGYDYIRYALIVREASREYYDRYGR